MANTTPRLWSRKEVAGYFGVSDLTVLRMIQTGEIAAYKIKGQWKFKEEDIEHYLEQRSNQNQEQRSLPSAKKSE